MSLRGDAESRWFCSVFRYDSRLVWALASEEPRAGHKDEDKPQDNDCRQDGGHGSRRDVGGRAHETTLTLALLENGARWRITHLNAACIPKWNVYFAESRVMLFCPDSDRDGHLLCSILATSGDFAPNCSPKLKLLAYVACLVSPHSHRLPSIALFKLHHVSIVRRRGVRKGDSNAGADRA